MNEEYKFEYLSPYESLTDDIADYNEFDFDDDYYNNMDNALPYGFDLED